MERKRLLERTRTSLCWHRWVSAGRCSRETNVDYDPQMGRRKANSRPIIYSKAKLPLSPVLDWCVLVQTPMKCHRPAFRADTIMNLPQQAHFLGKNRLPQSRPIFLPSLPTYSSSIVPRRDALNPQSHSSKKQQGRRRLKTDKERPPRRLPKDLLFWLFLDYAFPIMHSWRSRTRWKSKLPRWNYENEKRLWKYHSHYTMPDTQTTHWR